jgi:hypothetical protein
MQRRNFVKSSLLSATAIGSGLSLSAAANKTAAKEFYELRVYDLKEAASQAALDEYFQNALIPALNKYGSKQVGVFREMAKPDSLKAWVLIPYGSFDAYIATMKKVRDDDSYKKASAVYNAIPKDKNVYTRYTTSLMIAFDGIPKMIVPKKDPRVFELRTYESYSEDAATRKINMFNKEEFPIFYRTGLIPVFFGEVIAGDHMPCLTYLLTFPDLETKEKNWKTFIADEQWKVVSKRPEYADSVSKVISTMLEPLPYSQI